VATSVLVINCGSSSIKYALVSERREDRIYGLAENLGAADARIKGLQSVVNHLNFQSLMLTMPKL
jgi:acetate kinase